jgi:hypothetical protein
MEHVFTARLVDDTGEGTLTDGSVLWEVVSPTGERIASCEKGSSATALAETLNKALTDWVAQDESDRTVDAT